MYRTVIAPIVAVIFLAIQGIFGIEFDDAFKSEVIDVAVNATAIVLVGYGIVKNHKKEYIEEP